MTLIELLITMVIIAIISAAVLGTAANAFENARRARTRSLITKISGLVLERWDSYAERRVDVSPAITGDRLAPPPLTTIEGKFLAKQITPVERGMMRSDARLLALRECMKMEMPDSWRDVNYVPQFLATASSLTTTYQRLYSAGNEDENDLAECLYLTVMYSTGDGEARTLFSSQDIGDTDEDGAPEFLDGWGNPIGWIRWPAGFVSELQPADGAGNRDVKDHDPFDIFKRDSPDRLLPPSPDVNKYPNNALAFQAQKLKARNQNVLPSSTRLAATRIVPLIFSAGPDGVGAMAFYGTALPLDPYALNEESRQAGQVEDDGDEWRDNITNHINNY